MPRQSKNRNRHQSLITLVEAEDSYLEPEVRLFLKKLLDKGIEIEKGLGKKFLELFPKGMESVTDFANSIRQEENWTEKLTRNLADPENGSFRVKCFILMLFGKFEPALKSLKFEGKELITLKFSEVNEYLLKLIRDGSTKFSKQELLEWINAKEWQESIKKDFPDLTIADNFFETALESLLD